MCQLSFVFFFLFIPLLKFDRQSLSSRVITLYNVCSVHLGVFGTSGDIMSTSGDIMSTSGDIMSTSGDVMSTSGGYHEHIGDVQYIGGNHDACGGAS